MDAIAAEVKRHGKHYTPAGLADFLAQRVLAHVRPDADLRVLDPACGDGELLLAVHRAVAASGRDVRLTLVGYDLDHDAVAVAEERASLLGVEATWRQGDFLRAGRDIPAGSFDVVITNPPYVRTQQLGQETARLLSTEFGLSGRIDLTHPFVTMCPDLLRAGGVVGLLCSNRFLTTKAGANVRTVLQSRLALAEIFDLGDTKLFDAAVLPAIAIAVNAPARDGSTIRFSSAYEQADRVTTSGRRLFDALLEPDDSAVRHGDRYFAVRTGSLEISQSSSEPWRISHQVGDDWLAQIARATWRTFGDIAKIRVGIKTTADSVFISNDWEAEPVVPEPALLLPLVTHHNVTPWRVAPHLPTRVLYPYDVTQTRRTVIDLADFPRARTYLEGHRERLAGRRYVIDGGRQWFEIWVPHKPALWASPKIVFPDISENARFALDTSGAVVNGDCYWISVPDVGDEDVALLMLAIANSRVGERFYDEVCGNKLYSGKRRWMTQYVARFPVPDPSTEASRRVVDAVRATLAGEGLPSAEERDHLDHLVEQAFLETSAPGDCASTVGARTLF